MENHSGSPLYYYVLILLLGFAPWSIFFALSIWNAVKECQTPNLNPQAASLKFEDMRPAFRFLLCWFVVYFLAFSAASTKLPNYILPLYPAVALLVGRFLDRWRRGDCQPPAWTIYGSVALLALIGVGVGVGLLVAGGKIEATALRGRYLPGLEKVAWIGAVPILGMLLAIWYTRRTRRSAAIGALATTALLFTRCRVRIWRASGRSQ